MNSATSSLPADDQQTSTNDSEQFEQKLFDLTEQFSSTGFSQPSVFNNLTVEAGVVSNQHLAFLLDNGQVCRINYQPNAANNQAEAAPPISSSSSRSSKHSKLSSLSSGLSSGLGSSSSGSFRPSSRTISSSSFVQAVANAAVSAGSGSTNTSSTAVSGNTGSSNSGTANSNQGTGANTTNSGLLRANEAFIIPSPHDILSSSSLSHGFGRGRRNQLLRSRVSNLIVGSSRMPSFVPASAVPESLIESVQTVLQSKSRSLIIRELQRTNLDVNLAVNNLLQRDDEGDDPTDDEDPYMHGDDLISLLDINSHHNESVLLEADGALFDEDSFRLSRRLGSGRTHSTSGNSSNISNSNASNNSSAGGNSGSASEPVERESNSRKSSYRIRDQRWYESYRDELFTSNSSNISGSSHHSQHRSGDNSNSQNNEKDEDKKSKYQFSFGDKLEYWTDKNGEPIKFIKIAGMHSELIGVSADGKLHQWKWSSENPFHLAINLSSDASAMAGSGQSFDQITVNHPKTLFLQLLNEKICGLSSSTVRAACWTESGKIASWLDETIDIPSTVKYQTPAQQFLAVDSQGTQLNTDIILEMSSSSLFTLIRMSSGQIYWWGIMPFEQRAKLIDKYQSKLQKSKSSSGGNEITVGSYVSLKSLPLYNNGTVGFTVKDGVPRIGQINEHVFLFRDTKSFKFKLKSADGFTDINGASVEMPPPPSPSEPPPPPPAPLTGSLKRKKQYSSSSDLSQSSSSNDKRTVDDEEYWYLSDVVFVEDFKSSTILGKVIKVDNDYVLVQVSQTSKPASSDTDSPAESILLDNSRIFQKTQLQLVKQSSSAKLPDFMQRTPKKLSDFGAILTIAAHQNGLHAIITKENSLFYVQYDLLSNKITKEKRFTTSQISFLGRNPGNISFFGQDDPNLNLTALFDGNSTLYPLAELSGSNVLKTPEWKNLFPIKCFSHCLLPPAPTRSKHGVKKLQCVTFFSMRMEQLMASIFRCDLNRVIKIIRQLETDMNTNNCGSNAVNPKRLKKIMNERCDGNRNIFHAAVYICAPVSNNSVSTHGPVNSKTTSTPPSAANSGSSGLRPSKFSESGLSDIYAAYGTSSSSNTTSGSSTKSGTIERPWSTSTTKLPSETGLRKINISLEPKSHDLPATKVVNLESTSKNSDSTSENTDKILPTSFWPPLPPSEQVQDDKYTQIWSAVKLTEKERRQNAIKILQELLSTPVFQIVQQETSNDYLYNLLSHKSADGQTPFMYAVNIRAYEAALLLFEQSISIRNNFVQNQLSQSSNMNSLSYSRDIHFTNLIFPLGSRTDQSPLYVLCSNDTCSFTWTGDNHITQDIFECRTCTLVGNLCCCTECARICHKGHDCKIKTSSPTAYCDCWEKCKCKSLIAGDQDKRFTLLERLLADTNLLNASNFRGESLLIYLAQTVSRQIQEQRNYKRVSGTSLSSSSSTTSSTSSRRNGYNSNSESSSSSLGITGSIGDMPQHDLEPPKFSRRALEKIFTDWYSIKQIFLFNKSRIDTTTFNCEVDPKLPIFLYNTCSLLFDDSVYSDAQSGCVDLDKFIYILIMKCPSDLVTILVDTIQKKISSVEDPEESKENDFIARRLIRAVTRLFVVLCIETLPSNLNLNLSIGGGTALTSLSGTQSATASRQNLMSPTKIAINSRLARFKSIGNQNPTGQIASLVTISPIAKCEYILRQFARHSIQELADNAHSLIMPVVLGITKPSIFKLSAQTSNASGNSSSNTFNNNSSNSGGSNDYLPIGGSLSGTNQYVLAEEIFNIESPLQRQFTSSISTTLITPGPVIKKPTVEASRNSNFKNTFETVVMKPEKKVTQAAESKVSTTDVSMPPPAGTSALSKTDSLNQQSILIDSDNNNSSSSSSSTSSNEGSKAKTKSHLARSVSSNSNSENSNSNSSSGGESSSSEANSSDTVTSRATISSSSTANTKHSTIALKSDRNSSSKKNKSSRRVVQFNSSFTRKSSKILSTDEFSDKDDADESDEDEDDGEDDEDDDDEDNQDNDEDEDIDDDQDKNITDVYEKYDNELLSPSNADEDNPGNQNLEDDFVSRANIEDATNSSESSNNTNSAVINSNTGSSSSKRRRLLINRSYNNSSGSRTLNQQSTSSTVAPRNQNTERTETEAYINNIVNTSTHHHHPHSISVNPLPTSNSSISGPINQLDCISSLNTPSSNAITNNTLARVFSILIKLIRDLINTVYKEKKCQLTKLNSKALIKNNKFENQKNQNSMLQCLRELIDEVNRKLDSPWQWLVSLMDATEAQLRFGTSLSSSIGDFGNNTNALQYLRHLEERALLTNYFNNNYGNGNYYNYYGSNNTGGSGPFISSRFGSGIDARRKLNIMQHQHQQFANTHSNQLNAPSYHQNQPPPSSVNSQASISSNQQSSGFGTRASSSANNAATNTTDSIPTPNTSQPPPSSSTVTNQQSSNQVQASTSIASQFVSSQVLTSRKDFLSYTLSLMRTHSNEHRDTVPSIDISMLKHAAYVFDGLMFYLKCNSYVRTTSVVGATSSSLFKLQDELDSDTDDDNVSDSESESDSSIKNHFKIDDKFNLAEDTDDSIDELYQNYENEDTGNSDNDEMTDIVENLDENPDCEDKQEINDRREKQLLKNMCQRDAPFFKRSSSTLCLGGNAPDPFYYTLEESLPLATRPHLLQPHVRIQDMFRVRSNDIDQFLSLSRMSLMSSNLRTYVPYLKGPSIFEKKLKRKYSERSQSKTRHKKKVKKMNPEHTESTKMSKFKKNTIANNHRFLTKFENRLFKVARLNKYKLSSSRSLSKPSELIDRWRLTVDLFGRVFCDDVGLEPGSVIRQLGGFQLKEAKFRREMERLRNTANRELLMEVERDRALLLQMTFKSLNNMYNLQNNRRAAASASLSNSSSSSSSNLLPPLLCLNRIKVTFRDEQGEGSGVARSYYTAFCEAVLADIPLPNLDAFYNQTSSSSSSSSNPSSLGSVSYVPFNMLHRYRNTRGIDNYRRTNSTPSTPISSNIPAMTITSASALPITRSSTRSRDPTPTGTVNTQEPASESNHQSPSANSTSNSPQTPASIALSINAAAFYSPLIAITSTNLTELPSFDMALYNSLDAQHREYGQQLYTKINQQLTANGSQSNSSSSFKAAKITGMILELRSSQIQQLLSSDSMLKTRIDEGINLLANSQSQSPLTALNQEQTFTSTANIQLNPTKTNVTIDNSPLFWQPDKTASGAGFYAPRAGLNTQPRLNAFRNVGRIMAICLLQNELCPITLSRHCIKYILGRPIKWHDLAFFDSQMYESFRKMIKDAETILINEIVHAKESSSESSKPTTVRSALIDAIEKVNEELFMPLDLTFNIDLPKEEGGTNNDLIEDGSKIEVNCLNMYEFVKRYAEFRMVKHVELCLQELKSGVYDVLPVNALEGLTAEDFRLLLNGVADISIHTLASYTTISDESKESNRRPQFEKWFWATLEKMNQQEKQELLFFWTGSPYLPASEEGFQPLPTVTLRPPSDQHLPTANTCINRLYLPMYSSKSILKAKILQAIKTKTFGFV